MNQGQIECAKGTTHRSQQAKAKCPYCTRASKSAAKGKLAKETVTGSKKSSRKEQSPNFDAGALDSKISTLRSGNKGQRKGWDALYDQVYDSNYGTIHISGVGKVSIAKPYKGLYEREGLEMGYGNVRAEMVVKVEDNGSERYFNRTGIENSTGGVVWEYEEDDHRLYADYISNDLNSDKFATSEVYPKKVEITVFE